MNEMAQGSEGGRISTNTEDSDLVVNPFHQRDPSQFTVRALKVWLASQGASTRGNKAQLVERYATGARKLVDRGSKVLTMCSLRRFVEFDRIFAMDG